MVCARIWLAAMTVIFFFLLGSDSKGWKVAYGLSMLVCLGLFIASWFIG